MIQFISIQLQDYFVIANIFRLLSDGGLFFMLPILIMLLLLLFLIIKNIVLLKKQKHISTTYNSLINSLGLLTLVWGILGQLLGLVQGLDAIEMLEEISTPLLAGGLKISAIPTMFGCLVFLISRVATIVFTWIHAEKDMV